MNQYCKVKMALIIESIYISKNIVSLQIKIHEVYIKPLKPSEALPSINDESEEESEIKTPSHIEEDCCIKNHSASQKKSTS